MNDKFYAMVLLKKESEKNPTADLTKMRKDIDTLEKFMKEAPIDNGLKITCSELLDKDKNVARNNYETLIRARWYDLEGNLILQSVTGDQIVMAFGKSLDDDFDTVFKF